METTSPIDAAHLHQSDVLDPRVRVAAVALTEAALGAAPVDWVQGVDAAVAAVLAEAHGVRTLGGLARLVGPLDARVLEATADAAARHRLQHARLHLRPVGTDDVISIDAEAAVAAELLDAAFARSLEGAADADLRLGAAGLETLVGIGPATAQALRPFGLHRNDQLIHADLDAILPQTKIQDEEVRQRLGELQAALALLMEVPTPAEQFRAAAYAPAERGGFLASNFDLSLYTIYPEDLTAVQTDDAHLRLAVLEAALAIARETAGEAGAAATLEALRLAPIARSSGRAGSYVLASWFFAFDEDNWFSFGAAHARTAAWLETGSRSLVLLQGVDQGSARLIQGGIPGRDLPVILDEEEQSLTLVIGQLRD